MRGQLQVKGSAIPQHERSFNDIAKFPDIPGPRISFESGGLKRVYRRYFRELHLQREFVHDLFQKHRNIFLAFPKGRNTYGKNIEPVEQGLQETLSINFGYKLSVRSRHEPRVHGHAFLAPHAKERTGVQKGQELCLQGKRKLTNFVEEQGSSLSQFEHSLFSSPGSSEGACLVAEQFRLSQLRR